MRAEFSRFLALLSMVILMIGTDHQPTRGLQAAAEFPSDAIVSLKQRAVDDRRPHYRAQAIFELLRLSTFTERERVQFLTDTLHRDTEPLVIEQVISGLEGLPQEEALSPLFHVLDTSKEPGIRERAMEALFHFHSHPRAQQRLQEILLHDPDPALRSGACLWLGLIQEPLVFPAFAQAYWTENEPSVRAAIIKGIALQRSAGATRLLSDLAAREPDPVLRQLASQRLGFVQEVKK